MGDTTNVGEIAVDIVARTDKFQTSMSGAGQMTDRFATQAASSIQRAEAAFTKLEVSGKGGKRIIEDLSTTMGAAGGPVGNLAGAMIRMGPALGVATGGMEIFSDVMKNQAELVANTIKNAERYAEIAERVGQATGKVAASGIMGASTNAEIKTITKSLVDLREQQEAATKYAGVYDAAWRVVSNNNPLKLIKNNPLQGYADEQLKAQQALNMEIDRTTDRLNEELKMSKAFAIADTAGAVYKEAEYQIKVTTKKDSLERLASEVAAAADYGVALKDGLSDLPEGGKAYNMVLDKWRENYLKILDLTDQIAEKTTKAAEASVKSIEAQHSAFEKGMHLVGEYAGKANKIYENSDRSGFHPVTAAAETVKTGFGLQLDTSNVSAAALRMADTKVQKVSDPALDGIQKTLDAIKTNTASTGMARAQ